VASDDNGDGDLAGSGGLPGDGAADDQGIGAFAGFGSLLGDGAVAAENQEVAQLRATVAHLEQSLQMTTCLFIAAAREGLCSPPAGPVADASAKSTKDAAVLRPAGYRRKHKRWSVAKDHWATQFVSTNLGTGKKRVGFQLNTHNPDTEDIFISRSVHQRKIWDKPVFNVFKHVLLSKGLPPGRVLDVGGNIGYFTMWALAMGHKVTTFEPMDFNLRYLVTSIDANGFGANHTLYQNAVGNKPGRLSLNPTNKQNRGNYQVQEARGVTSLSGEYGFDYVDTIRLDDVVDEDVLLIKIDVEGFEHKVLDGARKLVCSRLVRYIEFEFTTSKTDGDCHAEQVLAAPSTSAACGLLPLHAGALASRGLAWRVTFLASCGMSRCYAFLRPSGTASRAWTRSSAPTSPTSPSLMCMIGPTSLQNCF